MRPVNLIPPEERRGESAPLRSGGLAYVVVAALAVGLAAVCGVVFLGKQVSDREVEVASLEVQSTQLQARAQSLASFTSFQSLHDARVLTVEQLAKSRFDWERVLRELSLVVPKHVWLTTLAGSVSPEAGESTSPLRAAIPGPALELAGCARTHRDVARLIAAMKDIDGVTRVSATDSQKSDAVTAAAPTRGAPPATGGDCQTRSTIPKFNLIAAFDAVAAPAVAGEAVPATPVAPPAASEPADDASGGVAAAQAEQTEARESVSNAERDAEQATNLVPGG